jgi:hypothetical protein
LRWPQSTRYHTILVDLKQLRVLDLTTTLSPITLLTISPGDRLLLAAEQMGPVHVWDLSQAARALPGQP